MAQISAKLVKDLRTQSGAGMMDCKKALTENDGDMTKAMEWLRQKGIASAGKKQSRVAAEGLVDSYIHTGGRIGVLVEVNCETDFVARGDAFKELVRDIAMQIAACPNVEYIKVEDIPTEVAAKEKEIEMGRDDLAGKPDNIKEKIVGKQYTIEERVELDINMRWNQPVSREAPHRFYVIKTISDVFSFKKHPGCEDYQQYVAMP